MSLFFIVSAQAEIFKCTNPSGAIYYNDKPCPVNDKQKTMKAEKDVVNGYQPKFEKNDEEKQALTSTSLEKENKNSIADSTLNNKSPPGAKTMNNKNKAQKYSSKMKSANSSESGQNQLNYNNRSSSIYTNNSLNDQAELTAEQQELLFIDMHAGETMEREPQLKK